MSDRQKARRRKGNRKIEQASQEWISATQRSQVRSVVPAPDLESGRPNTSSNRGRFSAGRHPRDLYSNRSIPDGSCSRNK